MAKKTSRVLYGTGAPFRDEPLTAELVERILKDIHKPIKIDDFLRILALARREKKIVEGYLQTLMASGRILRLSGGGYVLADSLKAVTGTLAMQRSGVGFVALDAPGKGEVFISSQHLGQAWHGDRVDVVLFPDRRGKNRDGRIVAVRERALKELVVRVVRTLRDGTVLCEPTDARITAMFQVEGVAPADMPAKGALVRVRIGEAKGPELWEAAITAVLGNEDTISAQEELVKANHAIPRAFPPDALREAAALPYSPDPRSFDGRRDLTGMGFVTIDGATARDFDDAIHVARSAKGYVLHVAIADVAHYVRPGSALDAEALLRGNSYYFPRSVEPMLPEALSNGLCSLNPGVPRLAMVAEISFSLTGVPVREAFYPAVIISSARLTYDEVRDALLDGNAEARQKIAAALPMLEEALALARALAALRAERGSLDFDLPEAEYHFDDSGKLVNVTARENHFIHKLIEEFMVGANEAVARMLTAREIPLLYRVHPAPDPDKLRNLFLVLAATGLLPPGTRLGGKNSPPPTPKALQSLLDGAKGTPHEYLVSRTALRTMMQAGYTQDHDGHFGLASECYCHFTSPIRRYADLVVHRALKSALQCPDAVRMPGRKALQAIADHINATERTAMEAEREMGKRMSVAIMAGHVGEAFDGIISGLTDFGMFVELQGVMAEGMVRLADLGDDFYVFNPERQELRGERGGRTFRLGQRVAVTVTNVSAARLEITLALVQDTASPRPAGRGSGKRPPARRDGRKDVRKDSRKDSRKGDRSR